MYLSQEIKSNGISHQKSSGSELSIMKNLNQQSKTVKEAIEFQSLIFQISAKFL